jgi:E3 SUMO-protein ligase PIAS1
LQRLIHFLSYFDEILKQSPESVEDVVVEADGEWHTSDNKYGSAAWKASHAPAAIPKAASPRKFIPAKSPSHTPSKGVNGDPNGKRKAAEIVVLDSDDEDEGRVKRELSPSFASSSSVNRSFGSIPGETVTASQSDDVIDLTLDSDDDEPAPRPAAKRTASEAGIVSPTEQIWKKGRLDVMAVVRPTTATSGSSGADYVRPPVQAAVVVAARPTVPVPAAYPPAGYSGPVLPPVYNLNRGNSTNSVQLPPPNQFVNRVHRW